MRLDHSELPPRARRIPPMVRNDRGKNGTTSACAENTLAYRTARTFIGNYLRVRGEYLLDDHGGVVVWELPPRARRIHSHGDHFDEILGTTSACAENTNNRGHFHPFSRNYLRVRGEYIINMKVNLIVGELPPRARRIQLPKIQRFAHVGTTSACAENTLEGRPETLIFWNYLRVRGEYIVFKLINPNLGELPPRARRILYLAEDKQQEFGTTSACAENTRKKWLTAKSSMELPPRARRIR